MVLMEVVECSPLRKVCVRLGCRSQEQQCRSQSTVRNTKHGSILDLMRQGQKLLSQCMRRLQFGTYEIIAPKSTQH